MKITSVYQKNDLLIEGNATVTLTERERNIIANALAIVAPKEVDIIPLIFIVDKIGARANEKT